MKRIIQRKQDIKQINYLIRSFPVTAILGPRQSGKTFLAKQIKYKHFTVSGVKDKPRFPVFLGIRDLMDM